MKYYTDNGRKGKNLEKKLAEGKGFFKQLFGEIWAIVKLPFGERSSFEKAIEKEIRKMDPMIVGYIKKSGIELRKYSTNKADVDDSLKGAYSPVKNIIYINMPETVIHEITHAITNRLIYHRDYKGPSRNEIAEYTKNLATKHGYSDMVKQTTETDEYRKMESEFKESLETINKGLYRIQNKISEMKKQRQSDPRVIKNLEKAYKSIHAASKFLTPNFFRKIDGKDFNDLEFACAAGNAYADVLNLQKSIEEEKPNSLLTTLTKCLGGISNWLMQMLRIQQKLSIVEYPVDPEEMFARIIDSLYSLQFEKTHPLKFPLTHQDLNWLASFKYKGKPMFAKGIEKYRLGLQMIEDGHKPEEVKARLEYATEFEYRGKRYSWPKAWFTTGYILEEYPPNAKADLPND